MAENIIHQGRNLKRIREILGIKQDALAIELGDDWNQQKISLLEQKEEIDPKLLEQVAKALKVPTDAIKTFSDEAANNFINTFHDNSGFNYHCTFNPLNKVVELYERLLASEKEKNELLQGKAKK
ncbi:helix-turn-helix domain-containing protein [Chitinophaga cymbidii]|uniref:Transcriptional regulator n=1 Tax=Chitinophaga cymbidii TaxID=1096750 RepID=A0A512RPY4_9BACT|nr:helix-turn-helix transcriptional regulator [Chitinophaga cymbidii]GEP97763.1 transcriptional regulator [Chitinophaga cymbidii]